MKQLVFLFLLLPLWASAEWRPLTREDTLDVYWDPDTLIVNGSNKIVLILINNIKRTKQDKEASVIAQAELNCDKHILRYQG